MWILSGPLRPADRVDKAGSTDPADNSLPINKNIGNVRPSHYSVAQRFLNGPLSLQLFKELQRRNVFRMAVGYIVSSWLLVQVADLVLENIGAPDWVMQSIMLVLALGFPVVVFFSWAYEVTPEGIKRESEIDRSQSITHVTGRKVDRAIVFVLVIALAYLAVDKFVLDPRRDAKLVEDMQQAAVDTTAAQPGPGGAEQNSIAVLPFVNMSGDPENEYFSDGLTEELLNTLVRLGGLKVTGRTSSFAFKGENTDLREIGRLLDVANILEGSVRKAGNRVRITAQLVKTSDGYHLWSETFDRELDDIFQIQEEIANQVSGALHVTLLGEEGTGNITAATSPRDGKAYEEYLRGMYIWNREPDNEEALNRARGHFERALEIDGDYVDALYGMFLYWSRMNRNGHMVTYVESMAEMTSIAERITELAPDSDRALNTSSRTALMRYEYQKSLQLLEKAIELYPANTDSLTRYANGLTIMGDYEASRTIIDRALELDPLSLQALRRKAFSVWAAGDCGELENVMNRALELNPDAGRFRGYMAFCTYQSDGDLDRAILLAEQEPLAFLRHTGLAIFHDAAGDRDTAQEALDQMFQQYNNAAAYQYAQIYASWGEKNLALDWLEKALEIRDPGVTLAGSDKLLDPLRDEPRFQKILEATGRLHVTR
jgi:TolB-like protein